MKFLRCIALIISFTSIGSNVFANDILCGPNNLSDSQKYFLNLDKEQFRIEMSANVDDLVREICPSKTIPGVFYAPLFGLSFYSAEYPEMFRDLLELSVAAGLDINKKVKGLNGNYYSPFDQVITNSHKFELDTYVELTNFFLDLGYQPTISDFKHFIWWNHKVLEYSFERWKITAKIFTDAELGFKEKVDNGGDTLGSQLVYYNPMEHIQYFLEESLLDPNDFIYDEGIPLFFLVVGRRDSQNILKIYKLLVEFGADEEMKTKADKIALLYYATKYSKIHLTDQNRFVPEYREFLLFLVDSGIPLEKRYDKNSEATNLIAVGLNDPEFIEKFILLTDSKEHISNGSNIFNTACEITTSKKIFEMLINLGIDTSLRHNGTWGCLFQLASENPEADKLIDFFFEKGFDINAVSGASGSQLSVLQIGMKNDTKSYLLTKRLIELGAQIKKKNTLQVDPIIHAAAFAKDPRILDLLVSFGRDLDDVSEYSNLSPLNEAIAWNNLNNIKKLLELGVKTNQLAPINRSDGIKVGPLHATAELHKPSKVIDILIQNGASVDLMDEKGRTPLIYHIEKQNEAGVRSLLNNHANHKIRNKQGDSPILLASKNGLDKVLDYLMNADADASQRDAKGNSAAMLFCSDAEPRAWRKSQKIINTLFASGLNLNTRNEAGSTALVECLASGNILGAEALVKKGASVNNRYRLGRGILQEVLVMAVNQKLDSKSFSKVFQYLVETELGLDLNLQDSEGNTALHYAAKYDLPKIVKILISQQIDGSLLNKNIQTPFDVAKSINFSDQDLLWKLNDLKFK